MKQDNNIYDLCKDHMHAYVLVEMVDGSQVDGIITGLDEENVYFALPIGTGDGQLMQQGNTMDRQYGGWHGGYGSGYHGGQYGHGQYGYQQGYGGPGQRFSRLVLPLTALAAISLLPWY